MRQVRFARLARRAALAACALAPFLLQQTAAAQDLTGAGGSFPNPMYARWFAEYNQTHPGVRINYQPIGSGAGIRQVLAGVVDFGATESPLTDAEIAHTPMRLLHLPTLIGAVVPVYNLPGLHKPLRFAPDVLADIFLGRIKRWNDSRLRRDNPGEALPDLAILPVYRADGSGTTFVFSDYLCKVSAAFGKAVGRGTAVSWPVGIGGKGNEGLAGLVRATPGALGYAEMAYAGQGGVLPGLVRNARGEWIAATPASIAAAAASTPAPSSSDLRASITDARAEGAYPIASFTWLLLRVGDLPSGKLHVLTAFLGWMLTHGESEATSEGYAPLPEPIAERVRVALLALR